MFLEQRSLDHSFILVYRQLQLLGCQPVSVIARKLGMKRTTMYYLLERLALLGVVQESVRGRIKYFAPTPLSSVLKLLRG